MRMILTAVGVSGVIALATGCSDIQSTPSTPTVSTIATPAPSMSQAQLCDTVADFFRYGLGAMDVRTTSSVRGPDADVSSGGVCTVLLGGEPAVWQSRRAPSEPDPTEGIDDYVGTTKFGHPVWMRLKPVSVTRFADFATRVGEWNGQIRVPQSGVRTAGGTLVLDDETVRKIVEFLVDLTQRMSLLPG
ncbi:hypothetical protein IU468_28530 [Nocardia farcinica]|nr:hypothetical protein [Nocardia farcinica]MBF6260209.1 hypothetical protein [Nocardia farcinica]